MSQKDSSMHTWGIQKEPKGLYQKEDEQKLTSTPTKTKVYKKSC